MGYERFWPRFTIVVILQIMPEATLTLSEHELYFLPPGTATTAPATRVEVEVDGEMRVFLVRLVICRHERDDINIHRLFYRDWQNEVVGICGSREVRSYKPSLTESEKDRLIRQCLSQNACTRYWHPQHAPFGIVLYRSGEATLNWVVEGQVIQSLEFRWGTEKPATLILDWPQNEFLHFCEQIYAQDDSQLRDALRWHELTHEQKHAIAYSCENGDWEKDMQRIFRSAQILVKHHCATSDSLEFDFTFWHFTRWPKLQDLTTNDEAAAIRWIYRWRAAICDIMRPSFWRDEPGYMASYRRSNREREKPFLISRGQPTAHEALEAQLELREFLRPHLPADEIEQLLLPPTNQVK